MGNHPMTAPFGANWRTFRNFLLDLVYPEGAVCRACGKVSDGEILCPACRIALKSDGSLFRWETEELDPDLTAYFLTPHTGIARTLVLRLKHHAEACAARPLADLMLPLPKDFSFSPDTVVTWVTMPESRRRDRMIDHGRTLAEAAARQLNLPCRQLLLRRETRQKNQASLNREGREANLKNAFLPMEDISFPVLLVDDVLTTGTTARRCAEALRSGGAKEVSVLTFTRAVRFMDGA
jgi:predicted amidophosphoribosyltransferase